jgi:hypothetical protein
MVTICFRHKLIRCFIFSSIIITILICGLTPNWSMISIQSSNNMDGHLLKINCEKLLCRHFTFPLIYFLKWLFWLGPWHISLFEGFNHVKNRCDDLLFCCVSSCLRCSSCVDIPCFIEQFEEKLFAWGDIMWHYCHGQTLKWRIMHSLKMISWNRKMTSENLDLFRTSHQIKR